MIVHHKYYIIIFNHTKMCSNQHCNVSIPCHRPLSLLTYWMMGRTVRVKTARLHPQASVKIDQTLTQIFLTILSSLLHQLESRLTGRQIMCLKTLHPHGIIRETYMTDHHSEDVGRIDRHPWQHRKILSYLIRQLQCHLHLVVY